MKVKFFVVTAPQALENVATEKELKAVTGDEVQQPAGARVATEKELKASRLSAIKTGVMTLVATEKELKAWIAAQTGHPRSAR